MNTKSIHKLLAATIDLGAHSARMLIAEYDGKHGTVEPLEELEVLVPLGSDVFRHGKISNPVIRMLCDVFLNFRNKMNEYGVADYKAIATSAVREAANAAILLERIAHFTGIRIVIFEGADEAKLDYIAVHDIIPAKYDFARSS